MNKQMPLHLLAVLATVTSLRVKVVVPPEVQERHDTVMECKFDLQGSTFGSVAWTKNGQTFFSIVRRRIPSTEVYPVPGINLDFERSNKTHILLNRLNRLSTGMYGCSVTTSGGGVQAAADWANLTVLDRPPVPLLVATRKGFFSIDTKNFTAATEWKDAPPVYSVGYNLHKEKIYYGQNGGNIINADYDPTRKNGLGGALILSEEGLVTSIAVDWLHNMLYFTDDYLNTIGRIDLTTEQREVLLEGPDDGVLTPDSIVVDPFQKYLFWGDNNESGRKIVASGLDGTSNRQTIVKSNLKRAVLALDLEKRRLFYISNEGLSSCKYDGSSIRLHLQHPVLDNFVNSLSIFDDYAYWSRYDTGKHSSGLFSMALISPDRTVNELPIKSILDLKVFHKDLQKRSITYSCKDIECSHTCTVNDNGSADCSCPENLSLTAGNTVCKRDVGSESCKQSVTTVKSKPVCSGELIFEEKFGSKEVDLKKWQHNVRISSDKEGEFVVFDVDEENTLVEYGNLVIRPTLLSDSQVNGNLTLPRCTSQEPHLCSRQAIAYLINPPIKSGMINTQHTFSFRYGIVNIRAKVPIGDWLFPVLNLESVKFFNSESRSVEIQVARVTGNKGMTCGAEETGSKMLMSGVVLRQVTDARKLLMNITRESDWTEHFHDFSLLWTPDYLSFGVDGVYYANISTKPEDLEYKISNDEEWKNSILALNSDEFYLTVGLSAGGFSQFPDDCIMQADKSCSDRTKPWRNNEIKSMLKFWQNTNCWSKTWKDSKLLVDSIQVKAL